MSTARDVGVRGYVAMASRTMRPQLPSTAGREHDEGTHSTRARWVPSVLSAPSVEGGKPWLWTTGGRQALASAFALGWALPLAFGVRSVDPSRTHTRPAISRKIPSGAST